MYVLTEHSSYSLLVGTAGRKEGMSREHSLKHCQVGLGIGSALRCVVMYLLTLLHRVGSRAEGEPLWGQGQGRGRTVQCFQRAGLAGRQDAMPGKYQMTREGPATCLAWTSPNR